MDDVSMLNRAAYSLLDVKSFDDEERIITGIASTPSPDRGDDVLEPKGAQFALPMPFLWQHKHDQPLGEVFAAQVRPDGIEVKIRVAKIAEPGKLKDRIDEAWQSFKYGLVRGLSIGWRPIEYKAIPGTMGIHATKWMWHELSGVTIAMNSEATILAVKASAAPYLAALGTENGHQQVNTSRASGTPVVKVLPSRQERTMKTLQEQITAFENTRAAKSARLEEIQQKAGEEGRTKDESERQEYDTLKAELKGIDAELVDLRDLQERQKTAAKPVVGSDPIAAAASRAAGAIAQVRVQANEAPGIGFARAVMCKAASYLALAKDGQFKSALDFAKERYPDNDRLHEYLKTAVPAATTTHVTWAAPLVYATNLVDEFIEYLRPQTIIGKFGMNGIPSLTRVPFNIRVGRQTSGGDGYWVGQGAPKPMTKFDFDAVTLGITKVANIAAITEESARLSSPSLEQLVRRALAGAIVSRIDIDFVHPGKAAVADVSPASITNGLSAMSPSGTTADAARSDLARIIKTFLDNNQDPSTVVLLMPAALALSLSILRNSLGQREFPDITMNGGTLEGLPVITSQYLANQSGAGNIVVAVRAEDILLADDGQVTVDVSREASLQFLDNPTNSAATGTATSMVSLWQTNSIGFRAERFINWTKARSTSVVYMDDVNWGSIGSPA